MPRAPPNSVPVSRREDAEPARSAGAVPSARSVIWEMTMTIPEARTPQAVSTSHIESVPARASSAVAARGDGEAGRDDMGAVDAPLHQRWSRAGPAMPIGTEGSSAHSAASSALLPSTDCRYCVVK